MSISAAVVAAAAAIAAAVAAVAALVQGWGMTETGICFLQSTDDSNKGTIGGPLVSTEFKVVSLPGLQYDARGNPPRCSPLRGFLRVY